MMTDAPSPDVCAVVVTYNRKELLRECLHALLAQTCRLRSIIVVNNVSTDGTLEMLAQEFAPASFPQISVTTLPQNVGGAGGFHEGVKSAAAAGAEWLWLMDDDTIAQPTALAELFAARARFPAGKQPDLLASKVEWTDGALHSMNVNWVNQRDPEATFHAAAAGTFPIRTATFVSLLFHRRFVQEFGLPIHDYFIWADDVEFSGRILRQNLGVAVPASVVIHKTARNHGSTDPGPRFYYHVRNGIWMLTRSSAFTSRERTKMWLGLISSIWVYLRRSSFKGESLRFIGRGLRDGLARKPSR
jgi:GT2 family glycosyltransferase